jgi:hypothetical protein
MNFIRPSTSYRPNSKMNPKIKRPILASLLAVLTLTSCETAHNAAVSTFRVIDAPSAYLRRKLAVDEQAQPTTNTNQPNAGPNTAPYSPAEGPPVQGQRSVVTNDRGVQPPPEAQPTATPPGNTSNAPRTSKPAASTTAEAASPQKSDFPYAKPVPGKSGYVFSPYDTNGGYVDVTGYSPGQKVRDPYSGKIFLVP